MARQMESTSENKTKAEIEADSAAERRNSEPQPEDRSRLGSIVHETRGLVTDLKDWVEIRVQLFQLEIEERIEAAVGKVLSLLAVAVLLLFTLLFLLIASAEGLGSWLGHAAWGYLVVGILLGIVTLIVNLSRPRIKGKTYEKTSDVSPELEQDKAAPQLTQGSTPSSE